MYVKYCNPTVEEVYDDEDPWEATLTQWLAQFFNNVNDDGEGEDLVYEIPFIKLNAAHTINNRLGVAQEMDAHSQELLELFEDLFDYDEHHIKEDLLESPYENLIILSSSEFEDFSNIGPANLQKFIKEILVRFSSNDNTVFILYNEDKDRLLPILEKEGFEKVYVKRSMVYLLYDHALKHPEAPKLKALEAVAEEAIELSKTPDKPKEG